MMASLLTDQEIPNDFQYSDDFLRVMELGLTRLEPWWIVEGTRLRERNFGLKKRYKSRNLVPFAIREDRDDVACWDIDLQKVVIVHDFSSEGYERREEYEDFRSWFRQAVEDMISFEDHRGG